MTADDAAQAMAAVALAGASVARAAVEVDRAKWTITALRTERDTLAAENARLRAQVQAVEALCDETEAAYVRVFQTPEQVAAFGSSMPVVQVDVRRVRATLATTEAGDCARCHHVHSDRFPWCDYPVTGGIACTCTTSAAIATTEAGEES